MSILKMRFALVILVCMLMTALVIANAFYQKKQFYPSVVYITKSNPSIAVIYLQMLIIVMLLGNLIKKIFFGDLRPAEFEHLVERSWHAITETCLAFTLFRDDFNPKFIALFTVLLFLKCFHWLVEDRVDYIERSPAISWTFHLRMLSLITILTFLDINFINHAYVSTLAKGATVQVVFGFEYAILATMIFNVLIKYTLYFIDANTETLWEDKAVYLLYTELVMSFIKMSLYLAFVVIMMRIYTIPLFAFRPMYYAIRHFKKALNDVILSRRAIENMNNLYPDATPEELQAADNVCIICREEMTGNSKKLPCNHIFHSSCLRSWFQRQQTCPTCRLNILAPQNNARFQAPRGAPANLRPGQVNPPINPFQAFGFNFFQPGLWPPPPAGAANVPPGVNLQQPGPQQPRPSNSSETSQPGGSSSTSNSTTIPTAPSTSATTSASMPQTINQSSNLPNPPLLMPPPIFPPFLPYIPPIVNSTSTQGIDINDFSLSQMSLEELQRLEGRERENVEARISLLRRVQRLLDSATIIMQHYSTIVSYSNLSNAEMKDLVKKLEDDLNKISSGSNNNNSNNNLTSPSTSEPKMSKDSGANTIVNNLQDQISTDNYNELRRKRIEKFIKLLNENESKNNGTAETAGTSSSQ